MNISATSIFDSFIYDNKNIMIQSFSFCFVKIHFKFNSN